jgi:diadenosine tetraphosphate (Ap4A) HIT family hydrolase
VAYVYDSTNIFARILRGEIPNNTVLETAHTLAFRDIAPKAPDHVLVIPKGPYVTYDHFCAEASEAELVDFSRTLAQVVKLIGAEAHSGGKGFRGITNAGENGVQEVPHFHMHLLAGRNIGPMICI